MAIPKKSGSKAFLQHEVGILHDYLLHTQEGTSDKTGRPYVRLSVELFIRREGVPEPNRQFLHAGYLPPGVTVSPDMKTLLGTKQYAIDPQTEWGGLVTSLFENPAGSEPVQRLPEEMYASGTNYESWMGTKCLFDRVVDKEATARRGPEVNRKTGEKYDRRQLLVLEVLALPTAKNHKPTRGTSAAKSPVNAKPTPAEMPTATSETDVEALDRVLMATLANQPGNACPRKGLGTAFLKFSSKLGQTGPARDVPRRMFASDDYLLGAVDRGVIDFDGTDDGQVTLLKAVPVPF